MAGDRIDLHLHTTCSDGVLDPSELFDAVRRAELTLFSVTDHDTMATYPMPPDLRDRCIAGLEVDSEYEGHTVHLLAYGVKPQSPLLTALEGQRVERFHRMEFIVGKLRGLGYNIDLQDVLEQAGSAASLGRPHLARALVAKAIVPSVRDAFAKFLADDGPAFVPLKRSSSPEIIALIHESNGLAVVAHPKRLRENRHLAELVEAGADGVEIVHPTATAQDVLALSDFAGRRNLVVTGGTDFHAPADQAAVALGVDFDVRQTARLQEALARVASLA